MLDGFGETQQKLLEELLDNKEGMTIDSLRKSLNISRTAVNQHIAVLEKEGYLENFMTTKTGGRPGKVFVLSNKGVHLFPKQYALFSKLLLNQLKQNLGKKGLEKVLRELGEQVAEQYLGRLNGKTFSVKTHEIAVIMKELGYKSSASKEEGVIKACNCVYHDLASETPEFCTFDLALMSAMSGRKVEQTECMAQGGHNCQFKIKEKLKGSDKSEYEVFKLSQKSS